MSKELLKRAAVVLREVWDNDDCYCAPSVIKLQKEIVAYLAQPDPEPVASINGWHGGYPTVCSINGAVLPVGMALYPHAPARLPLQPPHTTQIDQSARIAELERYAMENSISAYRDSNNRLTDQIEQLEQQLATLQAKREPLSDDEIRDCAESENLPYFENKEEFDAFARSIEAAHGIGTNHD